MDLFIQLSFHYKSYSTHILYFTVDEYNEVLQSSSLSSVEWPALNQFLKKPCLGASGVSHGLKSSPSISFKLSLKKETQHQHTEQ